MIQEEIMNKKIITAAAVSIITAISVSSFAMECSAATVDDVAEVARSYGIPEENIIAGYSEYQAHPDQYPPERLDRAIEMLHETGGIIITTGEYIPENRPVVTTSTSSENSSSESENKTEETGTVQLSTDDGNSFTRISPEEFINLSYDEKMAYISSFPQDQQQVIINNLTPAEYKSLIKQSPAEKKMEIVHSLSGAADEMGFVVTVDEVTDDSLTVSMRNGEGKLVNRVNAGMTVEETGYDRRGIFAAIGAALLIAIGGLVFIADKCFRKEKTERSDG